MEPGDKALMRQQVFLGQVSAAGLLLTVSALFYGRIFDGPGWVGPVIGATLFAGALAVILSRTSMGRTLRAIALALVGGLFVGLTVILPGTDFGGADDIISAIVGSTIDGWRNALAATLPIDTGIAEPLGFVTIVGWAVGSVTGALVARSERSASPVIPPVLFAALSLPLAAPDGVATYLLIAALIGAALLLALVRAVPQSQISSSSAGDRVTEFVGERMLSERLIAGAPILVLLALLTPLIAWALPFGAEEPFDPRRLREKEFVTASAVNPLAEIKSRRESTDRVFQLDLPAPPAAGFFDRLSLVSLESYDGANWTTESTYVATSTDVAAPRVIDVETLPVRQTIEIVDQSSPWLPAGQPVARIEAEDVWYDEQSGSLLDRNDEPRTYTVESLIAAPTDEQRTNARVDRSDPRYVTLPTIEPESPITALSNQMVGDTEYDRLKSLETFLREELTLVVDASSGTALGRVEEFLIDGEGYRDQFVAAFAIAARQQQFPTRITVGYRIAQQNEDSTVVFLETVTSEQYDAWPEVLFEGIGWISFDPVPPVSGEAGASEDDATQIPEGQPGPQGPTPGESDPEVDDQLDDENDSVTTTVRVLVVSGIFLIVFPLLLIAGILVAKLVRRRHRQKLPDPTERVLAGWQESKDRLLEAGVDIRPDMTVKEIVATSRRHLGVHASSSLSALAPYVTTTIYSSNAPGEQAADAVWSEVELFDRQLNETRSTLQNAKARVDPRPLLEKV